MAKTKNRIYACSWSSGKDSCLALDQSLIKGYQIKYLFNFVSAEYRRVSFHGAKDELVKLQSESLGIDLMQRQTTKDNYEEVFRNTLRELKSAGIDKIVRGDIHLLDLQDWVKNICASEKMEVISPIWMKPAETLLNEFVDRGFKAIVTCCQANKLGQSWVGRVIDKKFIADLKSLENIDLCGENGEYHTFVFDGPIFKKEIKIVKTEKILRDNFWFLDIQEYCLKNKIEN